MFKNKVDEVYFLGGLIGFLFVSPRLVIDKRVKEANAHGWRLINMNPTSGTNLLIVVLRTIILFCTLGLITFGDGVYLLFEKEVKDDQ